MAGRHRLSVPLATERYRVRVLVPRATTEGTNFWKTLSAWMAKGM